MPAPNAISPDKLARIIGTPRAPYLPNTSATSRPSASVKLATGTVRARLRSFAPKAGLLADLLGLSRIYSDDLEQLEAGKLLYDAFFRWARDATDESRNWPNSKPKAE